MQPRLLLISLNRETVPYPVFPLGVWVLRHYLAAHGVEVEVADLLLLGSVDALESEHLRRQRYDYVGVSVRNIDNLAWLDPIDYRAGLRECVVRVRRYLPPERIVLGGAGFSLFPEELLAEQGLTQGIAGEGEGALCRLMGANGAPLAPPDFSFARGVPAEVLARYYPMAGMVGLQTRRGCPFECSYCTYPQIEGRRLRTREPAGVVDEIRFLKEQHGIEVFYFVDCNFNYPPDYTRALLELLRQAQLGIRWYAFVNPACFDGDLARLMKAAGCGGVEFGSESGDALVLSSLHKSHQPAQVLAASRLCREAGLKFCHYLLLGAPGESRESVAATLELMMACAPSTVILSIGLRLYPGTGLARELARQGQLAPAPSLLTPRFYQPERITLPEILEYCQHHAPAHWFVPGQKDPRRDETMRRLRQRGARGPLWDYL